MHLVPESFQGRLPHFFTSGMCVITIPPMENASQALQNHRQSSNCQPSAPDHPDRHQGGWRGQFPPGQGMRFSVTWAWETSSVWLGFMGFQKRPGAGPAEAPRAALPGNKWKGTAEQLLAPSQTRAASHRCLFSRGTLSPGWYFCRTGRFQNAVFGNMHV